MTDYISREAIVSNIIAQMKASRSVECLVERILNLEAADVRPVVLCKDCKYWELSKIEPSFHVCTYVCGATFVREAEDFCSRGKKREER